MATLDEQKELEYLILAIAKEGKRISDLHNISDPNHLLSKEESAKLIGKDKTIAALKKRIEEIQRG